jgi:hypothetical protein
MKSSKLAIAITVGGICAGAASVSQAAIISQTFNITSAAVTTLYSGTLDAPCTPNPAGSFFFCSAPLPASAITITNLGGGSGTIDLKYDDVTGEITEITNMDMIVNDMDIAITTSSLGNADVTVRQGNNVPTTTDLPFLRIGTGADGSADVDQNPAVGVFQHNGAPSTVLDFATFSNIVDSCTGGAVCNLIPLLSIDALRYEIQASVVGGALGGTLRAETSNNSNFIVEFSAVPAPAAGWLILPGVAAVVARARRRRSA